MSNVLKTYVLRFENRDGRNVDVRRFANFCLTGGVKRGATSHDAHDGVNNETKKLKDVDIDEAIYDAVYANDFNRVQLMINAKVDLNETSYSPQGGTAVLHVAAKKGHNDMVKFLIKAKADIDLNVFHNNDGDDFHTALYLAAENGHYDVFETLLQAKADVDWGSYRPDRTSLIQAVNRDGWGAENIVRMLINAKANLDAQAKDNDEASYFEPHVDEGQTALQVAAKHGNANIVRMLIEAKANLHVRDNKRRHAIHVAQQAYDEDRAKMLQLNKNERYVYGEEHLEKQAGIKDCMKIIQEAHKNERKTAFLQLERLAKEKEGHLRIDKDTNKHITQMLGGATNK